MKKTLLIVVNVDWFFISHRLQIAKEALKAGYDVYVAAEDTGRAGEITKEGIKFIHFPFSRSGTNPLKELSTLKNFFALYKKIRPDLVHHITLKPVIYGSIAAKLMNITGVVNAIAGLGYNFTGERKGTVFSFLTKLMKFGFDRKNVAVIFQNTDDQSDLQKMGILNDAHKVYFTKGSGIDLREYSHSAKTDKINQKVNILFPTRMLWDKGVKELKAASLILKDKYYDKITFVLAGLADEHNKEGVPAKFLNEWQDGEYVKWVGYQKGMYNLYVQADIVTLPSYYREGVPKSLIEACAVGRPIVTTDSTGCRDCVDEGVNGFKVAPRSGEELAASLEKLVLDADLRSRMGAASRKKAELEFDVSVVIASHLEIYKTLLNG